MTALAVLVVLGLGFVLMSVLLPLGEATDKRARVQVAADAAALAGAKQAREDVVTALLRGLESQDAFFEVFGGGTGSAAAADYASRNGASVTDYHYAWQADRAEVVVRGNAALQDGSVPRARASAEAGVRWQTCAWDGDLAPSLPDLPSGEPTPTPSPGPPSGEPDATLECDGLTLEFRLGDDDRLELITTPEEIRDAVRPRLVASGTGIGG